MDEQLNSWMKENFESKQTLMLLINVAFII